MPPAKRSTKPGRALTLVLALLALLYGGMALSGHFGPELGLDLRGGTTVTLKAEPNAGHKVTQSALNTAVGIMRDRVNGLGVSNADVKTEGNNIVVSVPGKDKQGVLDKIGETALLSIRQVYESNDPGMTGATVPDTSATTPGTTPSPAPSTSPSGSPSPAPSAVAPSPSTTPSGSGSPQGLGEPGTRSGGSAAQPASFHRQLPAAASSSPAASSPAASSPAPSASPSAAGSAGAGSGAVAQTPSADVIKQYNAMDCNQPENQQGGQADVPTQFLIACGNSTGVWFKYLLYPTLIQGTEVSSASAALDNQTGTQWTVLLNFKSKASSRWATFTTKNVGTDTAIVLDGIVKSAERIAEPIPGGNTQITGSFSQSQAKDLANVLKYGALPLKFAQQTAQTVSATLGNSELRAGLLAGAIGLALVLLYSFFYYRGLSLVTVTSLALSAAIQYPILVLLGQGIGYTLTLAGIAGLIVAVGVTADSFVVFFERLRDEVREGNSLRSAVEKGWVRARRTIVSADLVSLLAAAVLYWLAIGDVRGFAFTLGLSTIVDLFVVFFFTKPLITLLGNTKFFGNGHRLSGLDPERLGVTKLPGGGIVTRRVASARKV